MKDKHDNMSRIKPLSGREQEVFDLLLQGCYYREISNRLKISYATVHTHLKHIYKKLQVRSRSQAVAKFLIQRATQENIMPTGLELVPGRAPVEMLLVEKKLNVPT
jgi:DNA-binding CsgD family transcriptional regulator